MAERLIPLRFLVIVGALSAFGPLTMDLCLPALPGLAGDLHSTEAVAQLTMSASLVGLALGQLLTGPVSDRFGRHRPLLAGVSAYATTSLLCALAPTMGLLIALRLIQGLAGGAAIVIARAIVRDRYPTDVAAWVFSMLMLVMGVAPMAAPVIGAQLLRFTDWRGTFVALTVIGCALLAASAWGLRETLPAQRRSRSGFHEVGRQMAAVLRDQRFAGYSAVLALGFTLLLTYIVMSPFVLQGGYGVGPQAFSLVFAANALGLMLGGRVSARLVKRLGPTTALRAGLVTGLSGSCGLTVSALLGLPLPVLLPLLFVSVSSVTMIVPNATALGLAAHGSRAGTASGLMGLAQFSVGAVIAPLASTAGVSAVVMAATMAGAVAAALLVHHFLRRLPSADPDGSRPGAVSTGPAEAGPVEPAQPGTDLDQRREKGR